MKPDTDRLREIIRNTPHPKAPPYGMFSPASVFLLLFDNPGPHILAIQKADNEGYPWANQVALPGGHVDDADPSPAHAAFREVEEELGIPNEQIRLIGSMGHFQTLQSRDIEVFTGRWSGEGPVSFDTAEIQRVLYIPVRTLAAVHRENGYSGRSPGMGELIYPFAGLEIWGVTAKILHHFLEIAGPLFDGLKNIGKAASPAPRSGERPA